MPRIGHEKSKELLTITLLRCFYYVDGIRLCERNISLLRYYAATDNNPRDISLLCYYADFCSVIALFAALLRCCFLVIKVDAKD